MHFINVTGTAHAVIVEERRRAYFDYRNDCSLMNVPPSRAAFVDTMPSQGLHIQPQQLTAEINVSTSQSGTARAILA